MFSTVNRRTGLTGLAFRFVLKCRCAVDVLPTTKAQEQAVVDSSLTLTQDVVAQFDALSTPNKGQVELDSLPALSLDAAKLFDVFSTPNRGQVELDSLLTLSLDVAMLFDVLSTTKHKDRLNWTRHSHCPKMACY